MIQWLTEFSGQWVHAGVPTAPPVCDVVFVWEPPVLKRGFAPYQHLN